MSVGVDIGANAVRVVQINGLDDDGFAIITKVGISTLKAGSFSGGRIRNPQNVAAALVKALKDAGVPRYGFVIGLSAPDVAVARYALPATVSPNERASALATMGIQISPSLDPELSTLATSLVRIDAIGDGTENAVLTVAGALTEDIESLITVCKLAGATPKAIDLSGVASMRSLVRTYSDASEIATIVDIGSSKNIISTRQGAFLRSMRTITAGGDDITRAILAITGEDHSQAERRKASLRLPGIGEDLDSVVASVNTNYFDEDETNLESQTAQRITNALMRTSENLIDTIAQVLESDGASTGAFTQGISLSGGGALLRGFKERLAQRVGVPVLVGRPWAKIQRNRKTNEMLDHDGNADPRILLALSTAIGLALWEGE
jgi:type IV pilus assembly protein PilM